jgi:hypothetical protein
MVNLDPGYLPKPEAAFEEISARTVLRSTTSPARDLGGVSQREFT